MTCCAAQGRRRKLSDVEMNDPPALVEKDDEDE
jgi:hypothetical protein